ncbi:ABC transporter substrate-binding protein [soil metagenome]
MLTQTRAPFCLALLLVLGLALLSPGRAQTTLEYWHAHSGTPETVLNELIDAFNGSQPDYRVVPRYAGNYAESAIRLVAALSAGNPPVLYEAEVTVFSRLAEEGSVLELSDLVSALPEDMVADFYPALWDYGDLGGRYGLPWNMSLPVLFYNASIFRQLGVTPPTTWEEFEAAAARLTTRNTRGFIDVSMAFIFETMVSTRGGSVVTEEGRPNFDSPEAVEALTMLRRLAERGDSIPRSFGELDLALIDFVRTKGMMAFATFSYFPQGERFNLAFEPGVAAVPANPGSLGVPLADTQMVILAGASEAQRQGAFAFWRFVVEPENQRRWVEASYFLPVRRSVVPLLADWYAEDPQRSVVLDSLEHATTRPRVGAYAVWQGYLEEALERAVRGQMSPEAALAEAQRRALAAP